MPTTATDRQVLAACALAIAAGVVLIAVGVLLEPPLRLAKALYA